MSTFESKEIIAKNGTLLSIRSCELDDAEKLQKFFQECASESTHTLICREREMPLERLIERSESALNSPFEIYLGVFDAEKIVGQLHFRVPFPDHPWIKHVGEFGMIISRLYWGKGIGRMLLENMETFATRIGVKRIEAKVRTSNERGISLYKKSGYEIEGLRKSAAFIDGYFEDEFYIAKLLSNS